LINKEVVMALWNVASVPDQPQIRLSNWTIKHCKEGDFFVGTNTAEGTGRVSTKIVMFDQHNRRGRTESGRVYELIGSPGYSNDGEYVWNTYKVINRLTELTGEEAKAAAEEIA
jgi:hypothetical protein